MTPLEQQTDEVLTSALLIIALLCVIAALAAPTGVKAILAVWFVMP